MTVADSCVPHGGGRRGSAIVFDPATQTVSTRKLKRLQGLYPLSFMTEQNHVLTPFFIEADQVTSSQNAPKWNSHVDIYVDQDHTKRLAATLDLGKLGWASNMMRLCGKYSQIVVMELPDAHSASLVQAS